MPNKCIMKRCINLIGVCKTSDDKFSYRLRIFIFIFKYVLEDLFSNLGVFFLKVEHSDRKQPILSIAENALTLVGDFQLKLKVSNRSRRITIIIDHYE